MKKISASKIVTTKTNEIIEEKDTIKENKLYRRKNHMIIFFLVKRISSSPNLDANRLEIWHI